MWSDLHSDMGACLGFPVAKQLAALDLDDASAVTETLRKEHDSSQAAPHLPGLKLRETPFVCRLVTDYCSSAEHARTTCPEMEVQPTWLPPLTYSTPEGGAQKQEYEQQDWIQLGCEEN